MKYSLLNSYTTSFFHEFELLGFYPLSYCVNSVMFFCADKFGVMLNQIGPKANLDSTPSMIALIEFDHLF